LTSEAAPRRRIGTVNPEDDAKLRAEVLGPVTIPDLHRLYDYWQARRKDGRLPSRADIDPVELPFVLGDLLLVDVLRDPLRFRYRLIGSNIVHPPEMDMNGRFVEEHPDVEFRKQALSVYTQVATTARPLSIRHDAIMDKRVRRHHTLLLPLASDGATVDMILVVMRYQRRAARG
jgi:hypothetical protein